MGSCPECGLPVGRRGASIKALIFKMVSAGNGLSAEAIAARIYAYDERNAPRDGYKVIHVHINQLNKQLAAEGSPVRVRGDKWHGYRIVTCPAPPEEPREKPRPRNRLTGSRAGTSPAE